MIRINKVFKKPRYLVLQQNTQAPKGPSAPTQQKNQPQTSQCPAIPNGLWLKCEKCSAIIYTKDHSKNHRVCPNCGYHYRLSARERIELIMDTGTFVEINADLMTLNPLEFEGYEQKLAADREKTGLKEAVVTGYGKIHGYDAVIAVMDSSFIMGSMGSVVGEKITRAFEYATANRFPVRQYEIYVDFNVTFNMNCIISLYFDRYEYTGGAHGSTVRTSDSWNIACKRPVSLTDLFPAGTDIRDYYKRAIIGQIEQEAESEAMLYFEDYEKLVNRYLSLSNFYLTYEGVVIYFQQYEIAPYATGIPEFLIPYSDDGAALPGQC
mgnify:CR=1 FL=1